ncbi:hypothetical protein LTR91_024033 [Friedmanniomyces endolithicus]|uniref:Uncharacterized protein n=1 Tax=Friedmanniomyces endolithicus TaxID=329885 RepID=A0AAN6H2X3_9PEZI|nr:hypothetical protein LTR94_004129 [Friedmanniomyces endolithicus]KAK0781184.1 hypothetical protein LTR59_012574 [Friedmanniomyces endolithicus]KAK0790863.1 hypothetical protein LTR75_011931 [Friedmanniomyces endolithicus]KAK0810847.1 hypothetical protein LTR38_003868 [Friedmanniomyces endolithicus]KAK0838134.1 hypothetical protein LTR03_012249 [Friedmanniomyces endolithicus]
MTPSHSQHTPATPLTPSPTPATPTTLKAYRVHPAKAWEVVAMLRAKFGPYTDPRQLLAAMNDDLPQLLFVCSHHELGRRPVEWVYATFGNPEKTHFVVRGCGSVASDLGQRGGETFVDVVGRIARRLGLEALEGAGMGELEGRGWLEMLGAVAVRVEAGEKAFDAIDEVNKRFTAMVLPRLLDAARTVRISTPSQSTGPDGCVVSDTD